ncbi:MAG: extensin family protein [Pseudomonadota bacterium]
MVKEELSSADRAKAIGAFLVALVVIGVGLHYTLPSQHNPLRPLSVTEPIGFATFGKLTRAKFGPEACFASLSAGGVEFERIPDEETGRNCGFKNALTLQKSLTPYGGAATLRMTCHQAAATVIWERHVARRLAEEMLGSPLARIETFGTFACRNVAGSRRRSEHAFANAIDVWGFTLEDGRTIRVLDHWRKDTPEGDFLYEAFHGGCRLFSVSLGPDFNAAHRDHFHFDMGPGDTCR